MRIALSLVAALVLIAGCTGRSGPDESSFGDDCRPSGSASYVFGKVTDAAKAPLAAAQVKAAALAHEHEVADETDAAGCYAIELGVAQPHDLEASKDGYQSKTSKSVMLGEGEKRKINFELER